MVHCSSGMQYSQLEAFRDASAEGSPTKDRGANTGRGKHRKKELKHAHLPRLAGGAERS